MERTSSALNKHGTTSSLTTLYIRHGKAATYYRNLARSLQHRSASQALLHSLISYHSKAELNFAQWLRQLPQIPVKPNTQMQFKGSSVIPSIASVSTLARNFKENEDTFFSLYQDLLTNNGLPEAIRQAIQLQSVRVQQVIQKLDRISKTGKERSMIV